MHYCTLDERVALLTGEIKKDNVDINLSIFLIFFNNIRNLHNVFASNFSVNSVFPDIAFNVEMDINLIKQLINHVMVICVNTGLTRALLSRLHSPVICEVLAVQSLSRSEHRTYQLYQQY